MAERMLLTGNEALALGAYHAGVGFASAYPGTPSTEILEEFARFEGVYAEWAPNEKVALEAGIGACLGGVRALAAMKHVGVNVAADPLFTFPYVGVNAGMVIVSADDPDMHSSQNEQDNRYYAKAAKIPMVEPSDSQEAYDLVLEALEISEKFDTPVLLRMTTRVCHSRGVVRTGERVRPPDFAYEKDAVKRVMIPGHARLRHPVLVERLKEMEEFSNSFSYQRVERADSSVGIITSGVAYQYAKEAFPEVNFLKLTMTNPLPSGLIRDFCKGLKDVYVVEELEPYLEESVKVLGFPAKGKERIPRAGELNVSLVREAFPEIESRAGAGEPISLPGLPPLPARPPIMCAGCPHRGLLYVLGSLRVIISGDIGCYTLGVLPPLSAMDCQVCMGASITMAHGLEKALDRKKEMGLEDEESVMPVVGVIGDSTFFHGGIPGLMEMAYNKGHSTVIILDNRTTAMTGFQDHPGTGVTLSGDKTNVVGVELLCRSLGIDSVRIVDPYDLERTSEIIKEEIEREAPSVIVSRRACVLRDKARERELFEVVEEACAECDLCLRLGCPALAKRGEKVIIDPVTCSGCGLCEQTCPRGAILRVVENQTSGDTTERID